MMAQRSHLVRSELGVVKLAKRVSHVVIAQELHYASPVLIHVRVANVACLAHVILQVLPRPGQRKTYNTYDYL